MSKRDLVYVKRDLLIDAPSTDRYGRLSSLYLCSSGALVVRAISYRVMQKSTICGSLLISSRSLLTSSRSLLTWHMSCAGVVYS